MIKWRVDREVFRKALSIVSKASADKVQTAPLFRHVELRVKDGKMSLACFNQVCYARIHGIPVRAAAGVEAHCWPPVPELLRYAGASTGNTIFFTLPPAKTSIKVFTNGHIELPLMDESKAGFSIKLTSASKMKKLDLNTSDFLDWFHICAAFTGNDTTRPALACVCISKDGTFMGTDTRSAFILENVGLAGPVLLRKELEPFLTQFKNTGQLRYTFNKDARGAKSVQFSKDNLTVWASVPSGTFPYKLMKETWQKHLNGKAMEFRLPKSALRGILTRAESVTDTDFDMIAFQKSEKGIRFWVPKKEGSHYFHEEIAFKGKMYADKVVTVSRLGLNNALKMCDRDTLTFRIPSSDNLPIIIYSREGQVFWAGRYRGEK